MPEERKLVTVLFADIVGSTKLTVSADAEVVRHRLGELFERTRAILEEHGGTVEKFIGDEVMAVFGVPVAHEDDAERSLRAAIALVRAFAADASGPIGSVELRVGVNTGEVVAGDVASRQFMVTGEAVNFAARLRQGAGPGEILAGPLTYELTRAVAAYGEPRRIAAKGFGEIEARPVMGIVSGAAPGARVASLSRFIGRDRELALLAALWGHVVASRRPYLVTLIGGPGIGKTRMAEELAGTVNPVHLARGRCAPYGEGIGLRPLEDIIGQSATSEVDPSVRFRRHVERLAHDAAVLLVLEDIHWADPALLDSIQDLVEHGTGPILVLCLAREDLVVDHPTWGAGRNSATITLGPLPDDAVQALIADLRSGTVPSAADGYVIEHAEGNPLFVHEYMRALRAGEHVAGGAIPPTLRALIAARLDRLPAGEHELLRRGSVIGRSFGVAALRLLGLDPEAIPGLLADTPEREMLVTSSSGDGEWSFAHALVRDVAYASVPKMERTRYHDLLSRWIERDPRGDNAIAAYHAEQAYRNAAELGADNAQQLAVRAFEVLRRAAHGSQNDPHAALSLYERAVTMAEPARAPDAEIFETRANLVMARLRLHGSADALAAMDALLEESRDRAPSSALVNLLIWKASVNVLDDPAGVPTILDRAAEMAQRIGDEQLSLYVLWGSAEAAAASGDLIRERAILERALGALPQDRHPALRVSCLADLVANSLATDDVASARGYASEALASTDVVTLARPRFRALEAMTRANLASGDVASASAHADAAVAIAREVDAPWILARAAIASASCAVAKGDAAVAVRLLTEALANEELARRPTMRGVLVELRCALAVAASATGDAEGARHHLQSAERDAPRADARVRDQLERAARALGGRPIPGD